MKEKFSFLAIAFVLLALTCATGGAQEQTPTPQTSNEQTTGTISGTIVNERGEPMPGASVFLRALGTQNAGRTTAADGEGRFRVNGLEAGLYVVTGYSPAYVYQLPEAEGPPTYYRVGDSVRVEMIKGGVITGSVANATGEPIVGIRVRALRIRDPKGQVVRTPQFGNTERTTDDRGMYRMYGLAPGTYLVSAGGAGNQSFQMTPYETDIPMYAPSSTRDSASEYTVRSGEETTADIRYRSDQGHTVSGTVKVSGNGGASVMLMPVEGGFMPAGNTMQAPGARGFEISGVGDGEYQLIATEFPVNQVNMTTMPDFSISEPKRITIKGADVSGIELITRPASSISGRVVLEPSKVTECQGKRKPVFAETLVDLIRNEKDTDAGPLFMRMFSGALAPDAKGAFLFRNLSPGRYRVNTSFHARFWYLQSISFGAPAAANTATPKTATPKIDPAAGWTTIKPGDKIADLTITLAEGAASIRGKVPVAEGATIPSGTAVLLVPAEADKGADVLRYFIADVASDGAFTLNNLPPGRYWSVLQNPVQAELATLVKLRSPESAEARTKLRRTAESQKGDIELKPCQTLSDYQLSFK
jgi:hypothetical protein